MAHNESSRTSRRRKSRTRLTYRTGKERKRYQAANLARKSLDSLSLNETECDHEKTGHSTRARVQSTSAKSESSKINQSKQRASPPQASFSDAPASQDDREKSPGHPRRRSSRDSKQTHSDKRSLEKSSSDSNLNSSKKTKLSQGNNDEITNEVKSKQGTQKRYKRHKSINFTTARDKKRTSSSSNLSGKALDVSINTTARNKGRSGTIAASNDSVSSEKSAVENDQDNDSTGRSSAALDEMLQILETDRRKLSKKRSHQANTSTAPKSSKSMTIQNRSTSAAQKSSKSSTIKNRKKQKKEWDPEPSPLNKSSKTGRKVQTRPRNTQTIPDRIKDLKVTKKVFGKWKPLAKSTKEYVDQILKSVVLDVIAITNIKEDQQAVKCLTMLKDRVLERLPALKAPHIQGDYRKMESQSKHLEETFLEKSRELNALDKKLEDEQRLLEVQTAMVSEYTNKLELCSKELSNLKNEKAYPLLQDLENVLDLPELPRESFEEEMLMPLEKSAEETHLCQTLVQLRDKVTSAGLKRWMDKLERVTEDLYEEN